MDEEHTKNRPGLADSSKTEEMTCALDDLDYKIDLSIRYHDRRRSFFDTAGSFVTTVSLISGTGVIVAALGQTPDWLRISFGSLVAAVSILNLVFRTSHKERIHHDMERRYLDLRREVTLGEPTPANVRKWTATTFEIDAEEPPKKLVLAALIHNEVARKRRSGDEHMVKVGWLQSKLAQFADVGTAKLRQPRTA